MVSGIPSQSCPCKLPLWLQESPRAGGRRADYMNRVVYHVGSVSSGDAKYSASSKAGCQYGLSA